MTYSYLTGKKSPPKPWGSYVGAKYDEEAGRRATDAGRDLNALESQLQAWETADRAQQSLDGRAKVLGEPQPEDGDDAESPTDGTRKLMDAFPDPYATKPAPEADGLGEVGKKMLDVANRPGTPEDQAVGQLEDGVKNVGERVDWQVGMNEMQDKLDEKKVVWVGGKAYPWNEVYKGVEEVPANGVWIYNNKTG